MTVLADGVHSHAPSMFFLDFQSKGVSEEPVSIYLFQQKFSFNLLAFEISRSCRTASGERKGAISNSNSFFDLKHFFLFSVFKKIRIALFCLNTGDIFVRKLIHFHVGMSTMNSCSRGSAQNRALHTLA
jgi:hypothetical protein